MFGGGRIVGTALVGIGLLMLLEQVGLNVFGWLWPAFVLAGGVALLWNWRRKGGDSGAVFSGVTLAFLGLFFVLRQIGLLPFGTHWPLLVFAPGLGLLVMGRIDAQRRDAIVPGWIAIAAAAVLYLFSSGLVFHILAWILSIFGLVIRVAVPLGLIGLGAWMLFTHREEEAERVDFPEKVDPHEAGAAGMGTVPSAWPRSESNENSEEEEAGTAEVEEVSDDATPVEGPPQAPEEPAEAEFEEVPESGASVGSEDVQGPQESDRSADPDAAESPDDSPEEDRPSS